MLIQWCIQCKSMPFWMSEGFHSHVGANLAGNAGTCWPCQDLAGVIDALWWCPTITVEMTAAACVMPDRKEHLPTMARFYRRFCLPNAANSGQGKGKKKKQKTKRRRDGRCGEHHGKHVNMQDAVRRCRAGLSELKQSAQETVLGLGGCILSLRVMLLRWHLWTQTVGTSKKNETCSQMHAWQRQISIHYLLY